MMLNNRFEGGLAFFVEAGAVGEGKHLKLLVNSRMNDHERSACAENFLSEHRAGLGEIDEIYGVFQLLGELTGEEETRQWSDGGGGKEGEIDVTVEVLGRPAE